ncbi:MAG: response regulator transcription factor [Candidatus Colwellbacteria bacterium]|nr:response regulator transcription factor [Candidatus Colwellbacteria bacterium]
MRLLVIEDEEETREFLKVALEEQSFAVDTACDGDKGAYLARLNDYDLIILDHILPLKDGFEVCNDIRSSGKHTPILMLSVKSEIDHKINLFEQGIDDYVTKPFSMSELLARVRAILRRPKILQEDEITIDDLVLNVQKQSVSRGDKKIYLTRKEFSLLEYLMRNAGTVVSRGMIMEHVWDSESDPFSNTIETHILNLRKKIELPKKRKIIHSVPGRGYKIDLL